MKLNDETKIKSDSEYVVHYAFANRPSEKYYTDRDNLVKRVDTDKFIEDILDYIYVITYYLNNKKIEAERLEFTIKPGVIYPKSSENDIRVGNIVENIAPLTFEVNCCINDDVKTRITEWNGIKGIVNYEEFINALRELGCDISSPYYCGYFYAYIDGLRKGYPFTVGTNIKKEKENINENERTFVLNKNFTHFM